MQVLEIPYNNVLEISCCLCADFETISCGEVFSFLDLYKGYHQLLKDVLDAPN